MCSNGPVRSQLYFGDLIFHLIICMCGSVCERMSHVCKVLWRAEKATGSPETQSHWCCRLTKIDSSGRAAAAMVSSHSQGSYLRTVRQKKPSFKLYSVRYFDTVMRKRMHVPAKEFVGLLSKPQSHQLWMQRKQNMSLALHYIYWKSKRCSVDGLGWGLQLHRRGNPSAAKVFAVQSWGV